MSSARQTAIRGPSFNGLGKRPDLTPSHQVDLLTGIGPFGARMDANLTKPLAGNSKSCGTDCLRPIREEDVLGWPTRTEAEFGYTQTEFGFDSAYVGSVDGSNSAASFNHLRTVSSEMDRPNSARSEG